MQTLSISRLNQSFILFSIFVLIVVSNIFRTTMDLQAYRYILNLCYGSSAFAGIISILCLKKLRLEYWFVLTILTISSVLVRDFHLTVFFLIAVALINIKFTNIIRIYLYGIILSIAITFFLFSFGIIDESIFVRMNDGFIRHSYGFYNVNYFSQLVNILILTLVCLKNGNLSVNNYASITILALIVYCITQSRAGLMFAGILIIGNYISSQYKHSYYKFVKTFCLILPVIILLMVIYLYYIFNYGAVENKLDNLLSFRVSIVSNVLKQYGVCLFGCFDINNIDPKTLMIDNSYAKIVVLFGVLSLSAFVFIVCRNIFFDYYPGWFYNICIAILIYGFVEGTIYDPVLSWPLMVLITAKNVTQ